MRLQTIFFGKYVHELNLLYKDFLYSVWLFLLRFSTVTGSFWLCWICLCLWDVHLAYIWDLMVIFLLSTIWMPSFKFSSFILNQVIRMKTIWYENMLGWCSFTTLISITFLPPFIIIHHSRLRYGADWFLLCFIAFFFFEFTSFSLNNILKYSILHTLFGFNTWPYQHLP